MNVGLQAKLHVGEFDLDLLGRMHLSYNVVEYLYLIDANFYSIGQLFRRLVSLFKPGVRHDLLEAVTKLRIGH